MTLVVVHNHDQVILTPLHLRKDCVRRNRPFDIQTLFLRHSNGWLDLLDLLTAEHATLSCMRIQTRHGDPWFFDSQSSYVLISQFDDAIDAILFDKVTG